MSPREPLVVDESEVAITIGTVSAELGDFPHELGKPLELAGHLAGLGLMQGLRRGRGLLMEYDALGGFRGLGLISHLIIIGR